MIKLYELLKEIQSKPKAIFMAGPPGSGKSTFLKQLDIKGFDVINIDDSFESLLKKEIGKSDFKSMSPEELSKSGELMSLARKQTKEKEENLVSSLKNIIIDGVGASSKTLLSKKVSLEKLGYETFMILIYVSPLTSLERNAQRNRSLPTSAVLLSWKGLVSNIDDYKNSFKNNIVIVNLDNSKESPKDINFKDIYNKFPNPKGKEKTPEEKLKKQKQQKELESEMSNLLKKDIKFDDLNQAKSKITSFIK